MTKIYYITIADKIKVYRSKYNVTQRSFAKLLGVSAQAIHKWEKQLCYPDITLLPQLARILECNVNDFFNEYENDTNR